MTTTEQPLSFDEFLKLLGTLNYTWTNTESLLIHVMAGLLQTTKDKAVVLFLTLNTTRARIDLVDRLAKLPEVSEEDRDDVLRLTKDLQRLSSLRNRFNHCIYSFDPERKSASAILMRIADRRKKIRVGEMSELDTEALQGIASAIDELSRLNRMIWSVIAKKGYPT